jgi:Ca2+-binding EF-hand superfamily protein
MASMAIGSVTVALVTAASVTGPGGAPKRVAMDNSITTETRNDETICISGGRLRRDILIFDRLIESSNHFQPRSAGSLVRATAYGEPAPPAILAAVPFRAGRIHPRAPPGRRVPTPCPLKSLKKALARRHGIPIAPLLRGCDRDFSRDGAQRRWRAREAHELRRCPMSGLGGVGYGGLTPSAIKQFQQNLFNQIDLNGNGSVSKTELEQAVGGAGGTSQAADALYSVLDPNNSGGFGEQQLAQVLPGSGFSDQVQAQLIGYQAQGWPGASSTAPGGQLAHSLFAQIDTNGDGSISKSELEQAVTKAGGSKEAADALYAKLDPNGTGSVSEQQLAQTLFGALPHHHHHHGGAGATGATDATGATGATDPSATDALTSLFNADGGGAGNSPVQVAQNIFTQIDANGDGAITQGELEQAVTAAGGDKAGADALYAKLDPNGTGSVSEQQFTDALQPPSPSGNTAQDALLALLDQISQGSGGTNASANPPAAGATPGAGNSAQDALLSLIKADGTSSGTAASGSAAAPSVGGLSQADLARAFALYQSQLEQQLVSSIGATQSAGVA